MNNSFDEMEIIPEEIYMNDDNEHVSNYEIEIYDTPEDEGIPDELNGF